MVRRHVVVHGRVQGVSFRDSCLQEARRAHVSGWVANRDDGTVEAVFEGGDREVDGLVAWCRQGPAGADVTEVTVTYQDPLGASGFAVR
jgi:acylphosphatase